MGQPSVEGMGEFIRRLRGLSLVVRFNFHYRTAGENVAEHSYWVALYTMILCDIHNTHTGDANLHINTTQAIRHALMHDSEESVTGDLPFLVKREIKAEWAKVALKATDYLLQGVIKFLHIKLHNDIMGDSNVHKIVKAADLLSVVMYAEDEGIRGNKSFDGIKMETVQALRDMKLLCVDWVLNALYYPETGKPPYPHMTHL